MRFTKMEGLGNDYVYLDCFRAAPDDLPRLARRMSDRHFGVGSDGLICLFPSKFADFRMAMFNADGSEGAMCGNGIRCAGKLAFDTGLVPHKRMKVETRSGVKELTLTEGNGEIIGATVNMGVPRISPPLSLADGEGETTIYPVSMGNPHGVCIVKDVKVLDLTAKGPKLAVNSHFPEGINVEFVEVAAPDRLRMRVWERGSGETLACGTGACAALAAAHSIGLAHRAAVVALPGGELRLDWAEDGQMYMTGPARTVFIGEWPEHGTERCKGEK